MSHEWRTLTWHLCFLPSPCPPPESPDVCPSNHLIFILHPLPRPPFPNHTFNHPSPIAGTQAWLLIIFTPLWGPKDPIFPAMRVWKCGRCSQGRESSDLILTVVVDTPSLSMLRPHGPSPWSSTTHSCLMAFAHAVLAAWNAELSLHMAGSSSFCSSLQRHLLKITFPGHLLGVLCNISFCF